MAKLLGHSILVQSLAFPAETLGDDLCHNGKIVTVQTRHHDHTNHNISYTGDHKQCWCWRQQMVHFSHATT